MSWIRTFSARESEGELKAVYERMQQRPMPPPYRPPHGDAPGIIRAHSQDPTLMALVFGGMSATLAQGDTLTWPQRELINTTTSLVNQCFY